MMNPSKKSMPQDLARILSRRSPLRISKQMFSRVSVKSALTVSSRSALASFLILIFGLSALLPLYNSSESSLPACCRRDGKHRCMMAMKGIRAFSEAGLAFRSTSPECPYRSNPPHPGGAQVAPFVSETSTHLPSSGIAHYEIGNVHLTAVNTLPPTRGPPASAHDFNS